MGSRPFTTTSTRQTHTTLSKLLNYTSWHRTYLPLQAVLDTNLRFIRRKASSRIKQYGDYIFPTHSLSTVMWANASIPNNAGYIVSTVPVICVACWRCNAVSGRTLYCRQNRRRYIPPQWKINLWSSIQFRITATTVLTLSPLLLQWHNMSSSLQLPQSRQPLVVLKSLKRLSGRKELSCVLGFAHQGTYIVDLPFFQKNLVIQFLFREPLCSVCVYFIVRQFRIGHTVKALKVKEASFCTLEEGWAEWYWSLKQVSSSRWEVSLSKRNVIRFALQVSQTLVFIQRSYMCW